MQPETDVMTNLARRCLVPGQWTLKTVEANLKWQCMANESNDGKKNHAKKTNTFKYTV